jgi:hypothetical protein
MPDIQRARYMRLIPSLPALMRLIYDARCLMYIHREEIENVLLRKKVFNAIASYAEITYVDPPTTTTE